MEKEQPSFMGSNLTIETDNSEDRVVALVEGQDARQESLKYQPLVAQIMGDFQKDKDKRFTDEQRWLGCWRNIRGLYDSNVQFTDTEKSQAFIKITKTKVIAAYNQVIDILSSGNRFPIGVEASKVPEGIAENVTLDPGEPPALQQNPMIARKDITNLLGPLKEKLAPVKDTLKEGASGTASALVWTPAKDAAKKLDKLMQDQFEEANADKSLRQLVFELCGLGTGIYKGPFAKDKEYPKWSIEGAYEPVVKTIPDFSWVSIWNGYPDGDASNMEEAERFTERHKMGRSHLRALKKRPYFRAKSIEAAIADGPNYVEEYWESIIKDNNTNVPNERWEVLEYWGVADKEQAELAGLTIPKELKHKDEVQINAVICNGHVLRLVLNQFTPARIPYFVVPYELNPYSIFGVGVAENMMDTQLAMNGFFRLMIDNAVLSSNVILEVNDNMLVPGQDMKLYPGKIFRTQGAIGQSIYSTKIQSVTNECLQLFDKARQLADESTGIPSYSHGQGGVQGIGRTAAGMSMLMGAAAQNIKGVIRNIDDYLLVPLGKSTFAFNMQFNFDKDFVGDLEIVAKGTESLMRNEVRSQKLLQFLQLTNNPTDAPWVKRDYLLRDLAETLDIEADKAVNDPREAGLQAMMLQQLTVAQGIQPGSQGEMGGSNPASMPGMSDPTGTGGGNIAPGNSPTPSEQGYSGSGGGSNAKAA